MDDEPDDKGPTPLPLSELEEYAKWAHGIVSSTRWKWPSDMEIRLMQSKLKGVDREDSP
jgi:hypothetical protein